MRFLSPRSFETPEVMAISVSGLAWAPWLRCWYGERSDIPSLAQEADSWSSSFEKRDEVLSAQRLSPLPS